MRKHKTELEPQFACSCLGRIRKMIPRNFQCEFDGVHLRLLKIGLVARDFLQTLAMLVIPSFLNHLKLNLIIKTITPP